MISSQSFFEIFNKYIPKFKSKTLINKLKIGTSIPDLNEVLGELKNNYSSDKSYQGHKCLVFVKIYLLSLIYQYGKLLK